MEQKLLLTWRCVMTLTQSFDYITITQCLAGTCRRVFLTQLWYTAFVYMYILVLLTLVDFNCWKTPAVKNTISRYINAWIVMISVLHLDRFCISRNVLISWINASTKSFNKNWWNHGISFQYQPFFIRILWNPFWKQEWHCTFWWTCLGFKIY